MKVPELLIPAGSLDVLKVAVHYGADAVYIGGDAFGLRAKAKNFSFQDMKEGISFAHDNGKKVYVTVNILAHNSDIEKAAGYLCEVSYLKPDALIVADPGIFDICMEICPDIPIHISTQANNTNYATVNFWHRLGAKRIVTARELSLSEIAQIRAKIPNDMEIETFVHGAMCISYSGRCLMSNFFTGRDANQGECTHPCRWNYSVVEETRPGEYYPLYENERGTYIFNSKDLCMVGHIPDLIHCGIDSFKVEGRMKTALYVSSVARAYRCAIDDYRKDPALYESRKNWYFSEVCASHHRDYTTGFFYGKPDNNSQIYASSSYISNYVYLGYVRDTLEDGSFIIEQKNKFSTGENIEIMKPDGANINAKVLRISDDEGLQMQSASHASQMLTVKLDGGIRPVKFDVLRKSKSV